MNPHGFKFSWPVFAVDIDPVSLPLMCELFWDCCRFSWRLTLPTCRHVCPDSVVKTRRPLKAENPLVPGVQTWQPLQTIEARDTLQEIAGQIGRADPDATGESRLRQYFGNTY